MKILMVLTYYLPHRTGLTLHVKEVAEGLVKRGHEVSVLCANSCFMKKEEMINGVNVIRLPSILRISRGVVMPTYPFVLYNLIKKHDVINIHLPLFETALVSFYAHILGKPVILTHHGDLHLPKSSVLNRIIELLMFKLYKYSAKKAKKIVGYSNDYADHSYYLLPFRQKVKVIYPPIVTDEPDVEVMEKLVEDNRLGGNLVIGFSGRFVEEKRPDRLIRAIPNILKLIPTAKIAVAGEYEIKYENFFEKCRPLIDKYKEHMAFLGRLNSPKEMASFYKLCDVLVLPSGTECFGMVQAESMLCGTPVVVNNTPGAREPVRVSGMGRVVNAENIDELSAAIVDVITNKERFVKPREFIEKCFNLKTTLDRYESVFNEAIPEN